MKKLLSIFLSVLILTTACYFAFTSNADGAKDYNLVTSWGLYKTGNPSYPALLNGTSAHNWMFSSSSSVTYEGQNSFTVDGSANIAVAATKLEGLTEGEKYTVSFKYYVPSAFTMGSQSYIFNAAVYKENAPLTNSYTVNSSYATTSLLRVTSATGTDAGGNPVWKDASFTITAGAESQYLALSFLCSGWGTLHFADIKVTEVPKEEFTYVNSALWGAYKTGHSSYPSSINGLSNQNWLYTVSETVLCNGQKSLAFSSSVNLGTSATKLEGLTAGEKYKVSFKYYIPSGIKPGTSGCIFETGVYAKDAPLINSYTIDNGYALALPKKVTSSTGLDVNNNPNWEEISLIFTAESEQYLTLSFTYSGSSDSICLSDFVVEKAPKEYTLPENWGAYQSGVIDGSSVSNTAFHEEIKANVDINTFIRFDSALNGAAAATKLEGLESGKRYTLKFKYAIPKSHTVGAKDYIFTAGVYAKNAPVSENGTVTDTSFEVSSPVTVLEATGNNANDNLLFKEITISFKAIDEQYLVITPNYSKSTENSEDYGNLYFADFSVTEILKGYDLPEDFALYKNGNTAYPSKLDGTSAHSWMFHESAEIKYDGANSLRMDASSNVATAASKIENTVAGKKYRISFKYYIPSSIAKGVGNYIFKAGVYKKDAPVVAGGLITDTSYMISEQKSVLASTGKNSEGEAIWNEISFVFDATDEQYLGISLRYASSGDDDEDYGNIYFADVTVKEVVADKDYNSVSAWEVYRNNVNTSINGSGGNYLVNETSVTYNGGEKSLKFNKENLSTAATKLQGLESGKKYAISFKYYITSATASGSDKYIFKAGVYKNGAALSVGVNVTNDSQIIKSPVKIDKATGEDANGAPVWEDFVTTFTATEDESYFGISVRVAVASHTTSSDPNYALIYIDDVVVYEMGTKDYGNPEETRVIDFEDSSKNYVTSHAERFEIVSATNYAGNSSKMLYYKSGSYTSDTEFNRATVLTDNDQNFTVPIYDDKVYKISYRYKIASGSPETNWLSFYTAYDGATSGSKGNNVAGNVDTNTWQLYETYYVPSKGQNYVSLSAEFGQVSSGIYVDDITITETDLTHFEGRTIGQDKYEVNFDDYCVPLDSPFLKVENAPAKNGEVTKAVHIPAMTSNSAITLNDYAVANKTEKVFAIPVQPNTRYVWSFWAYAVSAKPAYFGFYYNYNSTATSEGILRYHEQDVNVGEWQKFSAEFTTSATQNVVYTWFNAGNTTAEMWIDDITLEKVPTAVTQETDLFYCEDFYNVVGKNQYYENIMNGVSGVYEINVTKGVDATFSLKASGNGKITLSADGVNPLPAFYEGAPSSAYTLTGATVTSSIDFFTGSSEKVYLIIEGTPNIDELMIFSKYSAHAVKTVMGYETNPNTTYIAPSVTVLETN